MGEAQRSALWALVDDSGRSGHPEAATSLASADAGWKETGAPGGLKSDTELWSGAAEGVSALRGTVKKAIDQLSDGQKGLGAGDEAVTGLITGSAQLGVYRTWERYLDLLGRECGELSDKLRKAGSDHYGNEEATRAAFQRQLTKPEGAAGSGERPTTDGR
ncbi:hypothetical protein WDH52_02690 [Streptomyces sp. TRM70308]|uniref:hypothetical protein n=1 Tax=Streptomyces sp. TRM70308 TaxID=3131932 RepID=UPI003D080174